MILIYSPWDLWNSLLAPDMANILVHEEFIGLYKVPNIEAATIFDEIQGVLRELNIPVAKLRGQCYDGASAMSSSK